MKLEIISKGSQRVIERPPLLFVHGAWHGAWCWDVHFLDYFAEQGYEAHAVSLRGHGQSEGLASLRWTRIADYVEDVVSAAKQLRCPPVVIGHSMGGFIVQKYLETHHAPAAFLLASVPPSGVLATTIRIARHHPLTFGKVNLTMSLYPLVVTPNQARELFFSPGLSDEEVHGFWRQLQDESYLGFLDMLALNLPKPEKVNANVFVLGAEKDAVFGVEEVLATAQAYKTQANIFPGMAHDMMLEPDWRAVADSMLKQLATLNQPNRM